MSVQFILGRSGTGKTTFCIKAIVNALLAPAEQQMILLVPEQATYQAQRAILADKAVAGYSSGTTFHRTAKTRKDGTGPARKNITKPQATLSVLSFDRLQFLLLGKNTTRPTLSRIGQQMVVHRILRDNTSRLKLFGPSAASPGLSRQMAETIAELHQYAKTPDDIDQLLTEWQKDESNNLAVLKFADIGLIFKEYLHFIEGKFVDPDVQLTCARRALPDAPFIKGAKLWVDGFAGFTAGELEILAELLKTVKDAHIALCLDPSDINLANPNNAKPDPVGLFNPTQRTYAQLVELIKKCKLQLTEPIILDRAVRFASCPQLAHIERNVFNGFPSSNKNKSQSGLAPEPESPRISTADNIRIVSAPNARAEVRFVATQILHLVKQKDYRYRDIAVIASDIDRYQHYIRAYFDDYAIPFFIDKRKPLNQHSLVQLICSALQMVTGSFSHSDIFAYLKTGLVPIRRYDVDLLENYCLAFGINAADWLSDKDWYFADPDNQQFDQHRITQIRLKVSGPLLELRDNLAPADDTTKKISGDKFTQVIFDFLDTLRVRERIGGWIEEAAEAGDYATVDEHQQFYDKLVDIFDELVEVFAGQKMTCVDFSEIINSAFSQLTMAFIPPTLDQVLVGSIERSRHPDLKAAFLLGATQKQFPVPVSFERLLTDNDRSAADSAGFTLAQTVSQTLAERQYLTYIAFTRPSQFLHVTYPLTDDRGDATVRSPFIANFESLFENLTEEPIADEQISVDNIHSESELTHLLCRRLGKDTAFYQTPDNDRLTELLNDICSDKQLGRLGSNILSAINYDNSAKLDKAIVKELFSRTIRSSATKFSAFAACPYQYFARYILKLKERKEFKFEPLDVGDFYHRVLDALLKKLNDLRKDFAAVEKEQLLKLLREQISKVVQTSSFISNFARHSPHNAFIINSAGEVLGDCVLAIAQMVRAGSFRPSRSEIGFGKVKDTPETLGQYEFTLSDDRPLFVDGKIDRLDIANLDGEKAAIVFDYKRRGKSYSWANFHYGLDMQLPIYMLAVRNASRDTGHVPRATVAGAFYMPVEVSPKQITLDELSEKKEAFDYKAKGILNGEFALLLDGAASKDSKFYNFFVTKEGEPYGHYGKRGALKPDDFENVLRFAETKIIQLAEGIVSGKIDVNPYRLSGTSPCSYCRYKSVCRFDWHINDYNFLESLNKTQVLEKIGTVDG